MCFSLRDTSPCIRISCVATRDPSHCPSRLAANLSLAGLPIPHTQCMDSRARCRLRVCLHPHRWPGCHPFGPCSMFLFTTAVKPWTLSGRSGLVWEGLIAQVLMCRTFSFGVVAHLISYGAIPPCNSIFKQPCNALFRCLFHNIVALL